MTISGLPAAMAAVTLGVACATAPPPDGTAPSAPVPVSAPVGDQVVLEGVRSGPVPTHMATRDGSRLLIDGRPFRFQGLNVYDLADIAASDPAELRRTLKTIAWSGSTVVRFWAFAYQPPAVFTRILDESKALGLDLKFIPVLGNHWQHSLPEKKIKDADWYRNGYREIYRPHVARTVAALKDRPEVLMWEMMNEPECPDGDALYRFAADIGSLIRAEAPHLISVGTLSDMQPGLGGDGFRRLHTLPSVDIVSFHDYPEYGDTPAAQAQRRIDVDRSMDNALAVGGALRKPVMIGETGTKVTTTYQGALVRTPGEAMALAAERVGRAMAGGAVGTLSWGPEPEGHGVDGDGYGFVFRPDTPEGTAVRGRMVRAYPGLAEAQPTDGS